MFDDDLQLQISDILHKNVILEVEIKGMFKQQCFLGKHQILVVFWLVLVGWLA